MPDFTATRTYLYVAGNIISPLQNTTNETGIYNPHNAAFNGTSGHTHSGSTGDGPRIPLLSPATRVYSGAATDLLATDFVVGIDHAGARTFGMDPAGGNGFERFVTIYDATGNAGRYNITINLTGGFYIAQSITSITITEDNGSITLHYDLAQWNIVTSS